jgi:hypothetical protein
MDLREKGWGGIYFFHLTDDEKPFREHANEPVDSVIWRDFYEWLSNWRLLKTSSL